MVNFHTLTTLVEKLSKNHVHCGIGGSYLLQLYDLCDDPKDVDFWVDPHDIQKVRMIFKDYEEINEKLQLPPQYHYKIRYNDIDVDFVACFITRPNQHEYIYNIKPDTIEIITTSEGVELPCTLLEDWYIVYKLLNREEKAAVIEKYIYKNDVHRTNQRLEMSIRDTNNKLQRRVINDVSDLIWNNLQMDIEEMYDIGVM